MTILNDFRSRRGAAGSRRGRRRADLWVEELEARQVLATVTPLAAGSMPVATQGTNPALVSQPTTSTASPTATQSNGTVVGPNATPTTTSPTGSTELQPGTSQGTAGNQGTVTTPTNGLGGNGLGANGTALTGPFLFTFPGVSNSQGQPSVSILSSLPQSGAVQVMASTPGVVTPDVANQLPPILQGASLVQLTGPVTFAQLQRITADFIGGGHNEPPLLARTQRGNSPRPTPSASAAPVPTPAIALQTDPAVSTSPRRTPPVVPLFAPAEDGPAPRADEVMESQIAEDAPVAVDGVWVRMEFPAAPLLAVTLAAHWADRGRRLRDEDDRRGSRSLAV